MNEILTENFNPGAIPRPYKDYRDVQLGAFLTPIALPSEYDTQDQYGKLTIKSQNGSLSCTGHAWSYYAEILEMSENNNYKRFSPRFIYCQTYLPGGGASIDNGANLIKKEGIALNSDFVTPDEPNEAQMENKSDLDDIVFSEAKPYSSSGYAYIAPSDVQTTQQAIFQNKGVVTGVYGSNTGWQQAVVRPPQPGETIWGHAIYFCGWKVINGQTHIKFPNSWGESWGDNGFGYLPLSYFTTNNIFTLVSLADLPDSWQQLTQMKKIIGDSSNGKQYIKGDDNLLHWIFDEELLTQYHNAGIIDKTQVEWHLNLNGFTIGDIWAVIK